MKNLKEILQSKMLAGLLILLLYSCMDKKWDDYYVRPAYLKEGSIMHILAGNADYKEFSSLLRKTGYDSLLTRNEMVTVFAPKNGAFGGIDTTSDLITLKKIMGMHIVHALVFKDKMSNNMYLSVSGKPLRFNVTTDGATVNKINILSFDKRVLNGVVHEVESVIIPLPNLYEFVKADSYLSFFKRYIDSSFIASNIVDVLLNKITGYDTLGNPIYKPPIIYKPGTSDYLQQVPIDDEMELSTIFVPSISALNNNFSKMLAARKGNINLIIPQLNKAHGDTVIGYYFIPANTAYKGDSAVLRDYLFKYAALKGEVAQFANGINNFTNVSGNAFVVDQSKILSDSTKYASNGYMYTLSDITLPDSVYRRSFIFQPRVRIAPNPANPTVTIPNPQIVYRGGSTAPTETATSIAFGGRYTNFDFLNVGAELDIIMPYVINGNYRVNLLLNNNASAYGGGILDAFYGTTFLQRFTPNGFVGKANPFTVTLGNINVTVSGPATFTFRCIARNQNFANPIMYLSAVVLQPIN